MLFLGSGSPLPAGSIYGSFPTFFIRHALKRLNRGGNVAVCYIHPWELDPGKPRVQGLKWYHYYRIASTEAKFRRLLEDFRFISTEDWIEHERRS